MASKPRSSGRTTKKTQKVRENDALAPILLEALGAESQQLVDAGIPSFEPQQRLPFTSVTVRVPVVDPLQLFLLLLGEGTLLAIVSVTNVYTCWVMEEELLNFTQSRPWHFLTRNELIVWFDILFFMGRHPKYDRDYF